MGLVYYLLFFVLILKRGWSAAVAFSPVVTASAGDVVMRPDIWTTLATALRQHGPDAWAGRVNAVCNTSRSWSVTGCADGICLRNDCAGSIDVD